MEDDTEMFDLFIEDDLFFQGQSQAHSQYTLTGWLSSFGGYMSDAKRQLILDNHGEHGSKFYGKMDVAMAHKTPVYIKVEEGHDHSLQQ